jgi:type VI secretion system secreted protein Hcp
MVARSTAIGRSVAVAFHRSRGWVMKAIVHRRLVLPVLAAVVTSAVVAAVGLSAGPSGNGNGVSSGNGTPIGQLVLATGGTPIPILSYSLGASVPSTSSSGGGSGAGKVSFSDLNVMKAVDSNSSALLTAVASGNHYQKITLTLQWGTGPAAATWVYEFRNAIITSVQQSGSGGSTPMESVSIAYATISWSHTDATGNNTHAGWDIVGNQP